MFSCRSIVGEPRLGPCISKGPTLIETCALSATLCLCLSHTLHFIHCPHTVVSELPQGQYQGQAPTSANGNTRTHTYSAFISASPATVSQCLGRKIGLCRAQRLESPKAARQIQLLQSVMPRFASRRSTHFKLHSLSPTSQLRTDGFLCLLHCVSSGEAFFVFISLGFIWFVYRSPLLFSFTLLLFVSGDVCNTSLAVYCVDWFSHGGTWVVFSGAQQNLYQNICSKSSWNLLKSQCFFVSWQRRNATFITLS